MTSKYRIFWIIWTVSVSPRINPRHPRQLAVGAPWCCLAALDFWLFSSHWKACNCLGALVNLPWIGCPFKCLIRGLVSVYIYLSNHIFVEGYRCLTVIHRAVKNIHICDRTWGEFNFGIKCMWCKCSSNHAEFGNLFSVRVFIGMRWYRSPSKMYRFHYEWIHYDSSEYKIQLLIIKWRF